MISTKIENERKGQNTEKKMIKNKAWIILTKKSLKLYFRYFSDQIIGLNYYIFYNCITKRK